MFMVHFFSPSVSLIENLQEFVVVVYLPFLVSSVVLLVVPLTDRPLLSLILLVCFCKPSTMMATGNLAVVRVLINATRIFTMISP